MHKTLSSERYTDFVEFEPGKFHLKAIESVRFQLPGYPFRYVDIPAAQAMDYATRHYAEPIKIQWKGDSKPTAWAKRWMIWDGKYHQCIKIGIGADGFTTAFKTSPELQKEFIEKGKGK